MLAEKEADYSCSAVEVAKHRRRDSFDYCAETKAYRTTMNRDDGQFQIAIYDAAQEAMPEVPYTDVVDHEWCRDFRVLLLCMYAAMVEAGDA